MALAAAAWDGGLADPTIGAALISLGYDRYFAAIDPGPPGPLACGPSPGMESVRLDGPLLRLPSGAPSTRGHGQGPGLRIAARAAPSTAMGNLASLNGNGCWSAWVALRLAARHPRRMADPGG